MDPIDLLERIYGLAVGIYDMRERIHGNKAQCELLILRIRAMEDVLRGLSELNELKVEHSKRAVFERSLKLFMETLQQATRLIKKFTKKTWFAYGKRILKNQKYANAFQGIRDALAEGIRDLELGLNVQQLLNVQHVQDLLVKTKDHEAMTQDTVVVEANTVTALTESRAHLASLTAERDQTAPDTRKQGDLETQIEALKAAMQAMEERVAASPDSPDSPNSPPPPPSGSGSAAEVWAETTQAAEPTAEADSDDESITSLYHAIEWYELALGELLVSGSTGALYQGHYEDEAVAIKLVDQHHSPAQRRQLMRELGLMAELNHRHITQLYGACVDEDKVALVMEYMAHRDLKHALTTGDLSLSMKRQIALDCLYGLRYLHAQGIHYPQLSPEHVLLDTDYRAKLTDFWASTASVKTLQSIVRREGLSWLAPEEIKAIENTSAASDLYRFGLLLWSLFTGQHPFDGLGYAQMIRQIRASPEAPVPLSALPDDLPAGYQALIESCWHADPKKRADMPSLIAALKALPVEVEPLPERHYNRAKQYARERDYPNALACYQQAAKCGHPKAWRYVGVFYLEGLATPDKQPQYRDAYNAFLRGAEDQDPQAMQSLAIMLHSGEGALEGIDKNEHRALLWYRRAGELGNAACAQKAVELSEQLQGSPNHLAAASL